ncbi:unnamed protein product [Caenorhabditis brenneri]
MDMDDNEAHLNLAKDNFEDISFEDGPVQSFYNSDEDVEEEEHVEPTSENFRAENRYKPSQHTPRELPTIREEKDDARSNASSRVATRPASSLSDRSNDVSGQFGFQSGGHVIERFTENFYSDENRAERLFPEEDLIKKGFTSPVRDKQNSWEPSVCHYEKQPTPEVQNNSPGLIFANMSSRKELAVIQPQKNQESSRDILLFERRNDENVHADSKGSPEKSTFATSPMNSTKYETKTSTPKRPGNTTRLGQRGLPSFECSTIYESPQRSSSPSRLFSSRQPPNPITPNTVGTTNSDTMLSNRTINDSMIKRVLGGNKKDHDLISALEQVRKKRDQQPPKPDFRLSANQSKLNVKAPAIQRQSMNTRNTSTNVQPSFHDTNTMQQSSSSQVTHQKFQGMKRVSNTMSDLTNSITTNSTSNTSRSSTAKIDSTRSSRNRGGFSDSSVSTVVPNSVSSSTSLNKDRDGRDSVSSMRTISRASSTMTIAGNCAQSVALPKPIQIGSKRLAFGVVPVNETLTMEIEIENVSDRQCLVRSNLDSNTTVVRIVDNKSTIVDPKKSMKLRVSFTPNRRGRYQVLLSIEVPSQNFHQKIPIWGFGGVSNIIPTSPLIQKTPNPSEFAMFSANMKRISFKLSNSEGERDGFALMTVYDSSMKPVPNECIIYRPGRGVIVKKDSFKDVEIRIDTSMTDHQDDDCRASSAMSTASSIASVRRRVSVGADYVVEICWGEEVLRQRLRMLEFHTGQAHLIDGHDFTSHRFNGEDDFRKLPEGYPKILTEDNDLFASSYRTLYISLFSSTHDFQAFRETMRNSSNFSSGSDVTVMETTAFRHQTFVNDVTVVPKPTKRQ